MSLKYSLKLFLSPILFFSLNAQANFICPDWLKNRSQDIPTCPTGGLVPETFPMGAIVVSDNSNGKTDSGFTADVIEKVLSASGSQIPLIILPVTSRTMNRIESRIDEMPVSSDLKKKYKQSLLQVPAEGYTWQQDYFQPFVNPQTGQIILREVQNYRRHENSFTKLAEATEACGFQQGPVLKNSNFKGGHMGGNIETLPAGICLLGDDHFDIEKKQWDQYADQICNAGDDNRIKVPTSWLKVGHSDEIIKVIRNKNQPAPCDFSVVVASPKKAIEVLQENPNEIFADFTGGRGGSTAELTKKRNARYTGLGELCDEVSYYKKKSIQENNRKPDNQYRSNRGVSKLFDLSILIPKAFAGATITSMENSLDCTSIKNSEVVRLLTADTSFKIYNQLIQQKMNQLKIEVSEKLKKKLPQCKTDFIDVPQVFFGGEPFEKEKGKFELPNRMSLSILPNPTNAISVNDTLISPDPFNNSFKKYATSEYKKRGLIPEFVDTFDYAHQLEGNLHCSTNTIHICNPRGSK